MIGSLHFKRASPGRPSYLEQQFHVNPRCHFARHRNFVELEIAFQKVLEVVGCPRTEGGIPIPRPELQTFLTDRFVQPLAEQSVDVGEVALSVDHALLDAGESLAEARQSRILDGPHVRLEFAFDLLCGGVHEHNGQLCGASTVTQNNFGRSNVLPMISILSRSECPIIACWSLSQHVASTSKQIKYFKLAIRTLRTLKSK